MPEQTVIRDVTYVGTFSPIIAHIQHPEMIDRTLCGCRARWHLRPEQVERLGVCYTCQQRHEGGRAA